MPDSYTDSKLSTGGSRPSKRSQSKQTALDKEAESRQQQINKFIEQKVNDYIKFKIKDNNLWEAFKEDFISFEEDDFNATSLVYVRGLRTHLRTHGVWVKNNRGVSIVTSLMETLKEDDPTPWTLEEIENSNETFNSNISLTSSDGKMKAQTLSSHPNMPSQNAPQTIYQTRSLTRSEGSGCAKEVSNLTRMYEKDMKYNGENDSIDYKLTIFRDLCDRTEIPSQLFAKAYPTMLIGPALSHYYSNLSVYKNATFDEMCDATKRYFENIEYKRGKYARWEALSLSLVIQENESSGKSTENRLNLILTELRQLQLSMDPEFRTDSFLHMKLVNACRNIPACSYACSKPSESLSGLINDLRASIATSEKSDGPTSSNFFPDRQYYKQGSSSCLKVHPIARSHSINNQASSDFGKRKCYVCNLYGCWSKNHPEDQQQEARKRFKEQISKRFDRNPDHYIAEYEAECDNNSTDNPLDIQIESLTLDTTSLET